MKTTQITEAQFQAAQNKIDSLTRSTKRGTKGTPEEIAAYLAIDAEWEAANALPQIKHLDRKVRDAALLAVATKHNLI